MNEEYVAVFDMENVPKGFEQTFQELFTYAYNDYCELSNAILPKVNDMWDRYLKDFECTDTGEMYNSYLAGALDGVVKAMNKKYRLNEFFEFFIGRPDLNFAAHIKGYPNSKISFHLEKK